MSSSSDWIDAELNPYIPEIETPLQAAYNTHPLLPNQALKPRHLKDLLPPGLCARARCRSGGSHGDKKQKYHAMIKRTKQRINFSGVAAGVVIVPPHNINGKFHQRILMLIEKGQECTTYKACRRSRGGR